MEEEYKIVYEDNPGESAWGIIGKAIGAYNEEKAGVDDGKTLCFVLKSSSGDVVGGLMGSTHWGWFYISLLWVKNDFRGKGFGHKLLAEAEDEARKRGVRKAYLDTFSFQAPEFYKQHGYEVFGELEDFPTGYQRFYMKKEL
jgi:ribosomal protein S18 acetylase RimI-like enzyme